MLLAIFFFSHWMLQQIKFHGSSCRLMVLMSLKEEKQSWGRAGKRVKGRENMLRSGDPIDT